MNLFTLLFLYSIFSKAQSTYVGGLFPSIDHSGDINNKLSYGTYYLGAFPLINFNKPNICKDANFLFFYLEQSLSYKLTDKLSMTGSYDYLRFKPVYNDYINENRFYVQAKYKYLIKKFKLTQRLRFEGRFIQNKITNENPVY